MKTQQFKAALARFVKKQGDIVVELREAARDAGFTTWEACKPVVLAFISEKYGCPITVSTSNNNRGQEVLDRTHSKYEAANQAFKRLQDSLCGDADKPVRSFKRVPAPVRARVVKDTTATMVAAAIAAGLTKAELAEVLKAVKAGISFE
jgi:hypothetical protein